MLDEDQEGRNADGVAHHQRHEDVALDHLDDEVDKRNDDDGLDVARQCGDEQCGQGAKRGPDQRNCLGQRRETPSSSAPSSPIRK